MRSIEEKVYKCENDKFTLLKKVSVRDEPEEIFDFILLSILEYKDVRFDYDIDERFPEIYPQTVVVGVLRNYVPNYCKEYRVLKYKKELLQIYTVCDDPKRIEYGEPIVLKRTKLLKEFKGFKKYLNKTPLAKVDYLPEHGIRTCVDAYIKSFLNGGL